MHARAWWFGSSVSLLLALSGCPVTDDYYIEASHVLGAAGESLTGETTLAAGGSQASSAGSAASGGSELGKAGATGTGGSAPAAQGGAPDTTTGAGGAADCVLSTERCNGHDDDCDDLIDELACNSMVNGTVGCYGFVLPGALTHGYMLCTGTRTYANAQEACAAQNMRLAWLETAAENSEVSKKVAALSMDAEVSFGATDSAQEDEWFWDGGEQFWQGNESGKPVAGLYNAWTDGTPNDENNNEDCAVLMSASATWGDRSCDAKYAYLCEEVAP
jgi:hypothetical protein